jgi:hypothetical protein
MQIIIARYEAGLIVSSDAFVSDEGDNSAYLIYQRVLYKLTDLYSEFDYQRGQQQKVLLDGLKQMKYENSGNFLKGLYISFVNPKKYAVKKDIKER